MPLPKLSIVMPVYDEPDWITTSVRDACAAVAASPFSDAEVVIVDDGSGPATVEALRRLDAPLPVRVIRQANQGRFEARRTGIRHADGELVLLLDSRVSIREGALAFVAEHWPRDGTGPVWNAHVDIDLAGNPFARFWNVLTEVAYREYFGDPRTTSFGPEEFDRFPKGTTCFLAPRMLLLGAIDAFTTSYEDVRHANDDTTLIRWIAERTRIGISPGFSCLYRSRDRFRPFVRHVFHRGAVFVDGYGQPGTRFSGVVAAFFPASAAAAIVALRRPALAAAGLGLLPLAAAGGGIALRRPKEDVAALAALAPVWLLVFGAGMWRGAALAASARLAR